MNKQDKLFRVTEKDFTQMVIDAARLMGWMVYHTWASIHSSRGFPDLVLVRSPYVIFAEIKRDGRELTLAQREWLDAIAKCQCPYVRVAAWHPSDWEAIVKLLER